MNDMGLSANAERFLGCLAEEYERSDYPHRAIWIFTPADPTEERTFNELTAHRLIKPRTIDGGHSLTETGLAHLMSLISIQHKQRKKNEDASKEELEMAPNMSDSRNVFIIHGRNAKAREAMENFLRAAGLNPLRFNEVRSMLPGNATTIDVINKGMSLAHAVIALITPDEFSTLRPEYRYDGDDLEHKARWQARPNVIFEAGIAFAKNPKSTFFVLLGNPKLFTDVDGISYFRLDATVQRRADLFDALETAGCAVTKSRAWMDVGDFDSCCPPPLEVGGLDPFR